MPSYNWRPVTSHHLPFPEDLRVVATISPTELGDLRRRGERLTLVDVCTPAEYGGVHVDFAHNVRSIGSIPREISVRVELARSIPVCFACKSGGRPKSAPGQSGSCCRTK